MTYDSALNPAVVEIGRFYSHSPDRIWRALTDPAQLQTWLMPSTGFVDRQVGSHFIFTVPTQSPGEIACKVLAIHPGRRVTMRWVDLRAQVPARWTLDWTVQPQGHGTRLLLTHSGFDVSDRRQKIARNGMERMWKHALAVRAMARQSFSETFAHLYERHPFGEFLNQAYGPGGPMANDLADSTIGWMVAFHRGAPVGYAKLTPLRAPAPSAPPGAVELQQIYVLSQWQGHGVAVRLMQWALATAGDRGAPEVYLTVFDHNERAKRFYRRYGFEEVGRCTFTLGDRVDDDRVWRRDLRSRY